MIVTDLSIQQKNPNRVNVSIDGKFRFSLDITQVTDLGIKRGASFEEAEIIRIEQESLYGKLYMRALEYSLIRPRSEYELKQYLWKKTRETKYKERKTGIVKTRQGVDVSLADRVYDTVISKGYVSDRKFTEWWVENRNLSKGSSMRKIKSELAAKRVSASIIDELMDKTDRSDASELRKIIEKKRNRYPDTQKLMNYLARQGFGYDDIKSALSSDDL